MAVDSGEELPAITSDITARTQASLLFLASDFRRSYRVKLIMSLVDYFDLRVVISKGRHVFKN